jgi:hypothetical protein
MRRTFNPLVLAMLLIMGSGMLLTSAVKHHHARGVTVNWLDTVQGWLEWTGRKLFGTPWGSVVDSGGQGTGGGGGGGDAFPSATTPMNTN